uniref:Ephrin RBD domain-containing protein n=1 Tax=Mesocestoides corti TaxID=53468 RepID=A0A5K3EPR3_MESCO
LLQSCDRRTDSEVCPRASTTSGIDGVRHASRAWRDDPNDLGPFTFRLVEIAEPVLLMNRDCEFMPSYVGTHVKVYLCRKQ